MLDLSRSPCVIALAIVRHYQCLDLDFHMLYEDSTGNPGYGGSHNN